MAMAEMVAHILYTFNIMYLYFLGEVTVYFPFHAPAVYAKRGYIFSSVYSVDVPVLEKFLLKSLG